MKDAAIIMLVFTIFWLVITFLTFIYLFKNNQNNDN